MTEKRFTIDYSDESIINTFTKQYYPTDDISGVEDICDLLNALHEEVMTLRMENTKMKLVFKEVVDDLQREADTNTPVLVRQEYVDWINENVDLRFNGDMND